MPSPHSRARTVFLAVAMLSVAVPLLAADLPTSPGVVTVDPAAVPTPTASSAPPAPVAAEWVALSSPAPGSAVIGRRPVVKGTFLSKVDPATVTIIVDGTDFTAVAVKTASGFEVTPPVTLPAGNHQVTVSAVDAAGAPLTYSSSFSSKHFEAIDELTSRNDLTGVYEAAVHKPKGTENSINNAREEANLQSSTSIKKGGWSAGFDGNARYKEQSLPIMAPESRGAELISWTVRTGYEAGIVKAQIAAGDVVVAESPYTLASLGRKGAQATADIGQLTAHAFSVRAKTIYGTDGGIGVFDGDDEQIRGGSLAARLFSNRATLKGVYIDGGEAVMPSYNVSTVDNGTAPAGRRGSVAGFHLLTDFFSGALRTDMEADFSRMDDGIESVDRKDVALRFGAAGSSGTFNYDFLVEHLGKYYEVVGNPGQPKNREGAKVGAGVMLGANNVGLTVSRYNDNVRAEEDQPVNVDWQGNLTFGLNSFPVVPMSFAYQYGHQKSTELPDNTASYLDRMSHAINGQATWNTAVVSTSLSGQWMKADDRTEANADSKAWNARLAPSIMLTPASVTPSGAFSRAEQGGVKTDTTTLGLDARSSWFENRLTAELGTTWSATKNDTGTMDSQGVTGNARLAYATAPLLGGYFRPGVALSANYNRTDDKINSITNDAWTVMFSATAQIPYVY